MRGLDLFSGIGGFSLGLGRSGIETVAFCEIEEYPRSILRKHWPDVPIANDIRKLSYCWETKELKYDGEVIYVGSIELVCGGFPCQPFSVAGKQAGKEDDRHLWPEMFRLIEEIRPRWVIGENVAGFISMALDDVLFDLESEGYETQSFVIPACAVGGIHRRDRVWIVAHTSSRRLSESSQREVEQSRGTRPIGSSFIDAANSESRQDGGLLREGFQSNTGSISGAVSNANNERLQGKSIAEGNESVRTKSNVKQPSGRDSAQPFRTIKPPTQSAVRHRNDGLPNNVARLKALGNAVVPQIPEMIGRAIMELEAD